MTSEKLNIDLLTDAEFAALMGGVLPRTMSPITSDSVIPPLNHDTNPLGNLRHYAPDPAADHKPPSDNK